MALEALDQTAGNAPTQNSGGLPTFDPNYYLAQNPVTQTAQPDYKSQIEGLYQTELKRPGDVGGVEYWTSQAAAGVPIEQIRAAMQASSEAQALKNTGATSNIEVDPKNMGVTQQQVTQAPGTFTDAQVAAYIRDNNLTGQAVTNAMNAFNISPEQLQKAQALLASNDPSIAAATQAYNASVATDPSAVLKNKAIYDPATGKGALVDVGQIYEQVLGRTPDAEGLAYWSNALTSGKSIDEIKQAFLQSEEAKTSPYASIARDYQTYLNRPIDKEGLEYWRAQLDLGKTPQQIAHEIALSDESVKANTTQVKDLLEATLGKDIVSNLTPEQLTEYTKTFLDPTRVQQKVPLTQSEFDNDWYLKQNPDVIPVYGSSPDSGWRHYLENGFREGRLGSPTDSNAPKYGTSNDNLKDIYKQIALDPTLGPQLKTSNPYLYEAVTPITQVAPQNSGRSLYGYFGMYNNVPILNAAAVDRMIDAGYGSDFSHGRGRGTIDIGWTSNSYSNKILRGAEALGVTKNYDSEGSFSGYSGLDQAADMLKIDKSQFKDKQVQDVTPDQYDEAGNLVAKGGQPAFTTDENGNKVPVMKTVSAQDQLYDAINDASKNLYLATMDSLEPGAAREGGSRSFQTVMYQKVGDKLLAISAPQSHGGMQNYDVYNPSHGFLVDSGIIQGATFVGSMALMAMTAGGAAPLASIGGAVTAGAATGTAASVVGGAVVGAALAAGNIAGSGGTVTGEKLLPGAIAGGVGAAMGPLLNSSDTMKSAMDSIAKASGGLYTSAQVSNIIGNTLANTLATAARGANGDQILKSFTTSLAANGIGQSAATGITEALKKIEGFSPDTIAKVAKAGQMLSSVASTAALTGKNQDQIMQAIITQLTDPTKLAGNIATVAGTRSDIKPGDLTPAKLSNDNSEKFFGIPADEFKKIWTESTSMFTGEKSLQADVSGNIIFGESGKIPGTDTFIDLKHGVSADLKAAVDRAEQQDLSQGLQVTATGFTPTLDLQQYSKEKTELDAALQNKEITEEQYKKDIASLDKEFDSQLTGAKNAVNFLSTLIGAGVMPNLALSKVSSATGIASADLAKLISGTGPKTATGTVTTGTGVTGTTGVTGVTGTGTGVTGVTGTGTGVTGVTGTGTGVTGVTGTGGGGTGGDGTGTGVTGTGTGGGGTGTGTGGGGTGTGGGGTGTGTSVTTKTTSPFNYGGGSDTQGIYNLTPGLTKARTDYELAGRFGMATGGAVATSQYDPFGLEKSSYGSGDSAGISDPTSSPFVGSSLKMPKLTVGVTKRNVDYNLPGVSPKFKAEGGTIEGHNPQFFSEGGLGSLENRYVKGNGNGTSDDVPAMLANGEFVIPADVVSALGNGSNDAGAGILDQFLQTIREHKQKHAANKLPPDSKGPLAYLLEAKKRA